MYGEELGACGFEEEYLNENEEIMFIVFLHNVVYCNVLISKKDFPEFDVPQIPAGDLDIIALANLLCELWPNEDTVELCRGIGIDAHYEHTHAVFWLSGQVTRGVPPYDRRQPNLFAKTAYNRMLNPDTLIWIAAALGEDRETLQSAARARDSAGKRPAQTCAAVRKVLPFSRILELFGCRTGNE